MHVRCNVVFTREMKVGGLPGTLATLCLEILCMFLRRLALMGAVWGSIQRVRLLWGRESLVRWMPCLWISELSHDQIEYLEGECKLRLLGYVPSLPLCGSRSYSGRPISIGASGSQEALNGCGIGAPNCLGCLGWKAWIPRVQTSVVGFEVTYWFLNGSPWWDICECDDC